jgi:hypothetical protein
MNEQNLIPQSERTKSEQREIAKMGGIRSGEVRRERKLISQVLKDMILGGKTKTTIKNPDTGEEKEITITPELLNLGVIKKAIKGNTRAYELVMAYLEGKPVETVKEQIDQTVNIVVKDEKQREKLAEFMNS